MPAISPPTSTPVLPRSDATWQEWLGYGLSWVERYPDDLTARILSPALAGPTQPHRGATLPALEEGASLPRQLTMHAYREETPGPRWQALFDATWPAYRGWYLVEGELTRPLLEECRDALQTHMPELLPVWLRLVELTGRDPLAARMLSMWGLPAFAVGCSQAVIPGQRPTLARNYDYDQALFEAVIASTDYSGSRQVLGTSDLLWGLLDGMNSDGLTVSLAYGGRPGCGEGFGIPLVVRYLLETCGTVAEAVSALHRIPVAQSYNVALADTRGAHATVFVAPGEEAEVSRIEATTNHRLAHVEFPERAELLNSRGRQEELLRLRRDDVSGEDLLNALLTAPLRNDRFDLGFGTLYTALYRPAGGSATWHWPGASWRRTFDDPDGTRTVILTP